MSNRCEDYPCCGHTDGLPCDWKPDYSNPHFLCDHEIGQCDVDDAIDSVFEDECEPQNGVCITDDPECYTCTHYWLDFHADGMEDQWLDGSYEE